MSQKKTLVVVMLIIGLFFVGKTIYSAVIKQQQKAHEFALLEQVVIQGIDCSLEFLTGGVKVNPHCLATKPSFLADYFTETIDNRWDDIVGFTDEYAIHSGEFTYTGAQPIFSGQLQQFANSLEDMSSRKWEPQKRSGDKVILSYEEYDVWRMMHFSYYVTPRDRLDQLGPCSRINYDVAMIVIDQQYLEPGQEINLNKQLAHRIGYCGTPESLSDYVFQGGVCGATSQIFRTALIHPDLEVLERHPHNIWYERYYDETIWGDDAAIIEFRKQLRISNTGTYPVYFRTDNPDSAEIAWIVAISPYQDDRSVSVIRGQIDHMAGEVSRTVYDGEAQPLNQASWTSEYHYRESGVVN